MHVGIKQSQNGDLGRKGVFGSCLRPATIGWIIAMTGSNVISVQQEKKAFKQRNYRSITAANEENKKNKTEHQGN